ncbi:hypothetical protein O1L44_32025 [Streptomyces noursei]|uniref:hypothetical protein n=1 Tax=Streptomyces noursei TaxID=1971 RepID=UPI00082E7786|nr:hypothetical protein [Streptomyces noursei]
MGISISVTVLLAITVFALVRKSGLKAGHAAVCILLRFYLASSSLAPTISRLTASLANVVGGIKL